MRKKGQFLGGLFAAVSKVFVSTVQESLSKRNLPNALKLKADKVRGILYGGTVSRMYPLDHVSEPNELGTCEMKPMGEQVR